MNGYPTEWVKLVEMAHLLDPLSSEIIDELSRAYFYLGREKEALNFWESNRRFAPYVVSGSIVNYYIKKRDFEAAEKEVKTLEALGPDESTTIMARGIISAAMGNTEGAQEAIDILQKRFKEGATTDRNIGFIRYFLGDIDAFFTAMSDLLKSMYLRQKRYVILRFMKKQDKIRDTQN